MNEFEVLVKENEKRIKAIARTWETNKYIRAYGLTELEDLYQECLIGFWKAYETFDETGGLSKFKTYSERVIKHHMLNITIHQRRKAAGKDGDSVWQEGLGLVDEYEEAPDTLEVSDVIKDVRRALNSELTEEAKSLYQFYFVHGLSFDEIAIVMNTYKMDVYRKLTGLLKNKRLINRLAAYHSGQRVVK